MDSFAYLPEFKRKELSGAETAKIKGQPIWQRTENQDGKYIQNIEYLCMVNKGLYKQNIA